MTRCAAALLVALLLAGCGAEGTPVAREAQPDCRRYCLTVHPAEGDRSTVFTFTGRGWRPNRRMGASFGRFCDIRTEGACNDDAIGTSFRTDHRGGFRFRFRNGPEPVGVGSASANGSGPPVFEQWTGRAYFSRLIRRTVSIVVDGHREEVLLGD